VQCLPSAAKAVIPRALAARLKPRPFKANLDDPASLMAAAEKQSSFARWTAEGGCPHITISRLGGQGCFPYMNRALDQQNSAQLNIMEHSALSDGEIRRGADGN